MIGDTRPTLAQIAAAVPDSLGSHGPVVARVRRVLDEPHSSVDRVAEAISSDVDLTLRLIRCANSSWHGSRAPVETLSEAVAIIGSEQVYAMVVATNIVHHFAGIPQDFVSMKSFWRHSLATALAAGGISRLRRLPNAENHFLAGLLHDLGRLVLFQHFPALAQQILRTHQELNSHASGGRITLQRAELAVLGFDHQAIGQGLLHKWGFLPALATAAGYHHNPALAPSHRMEASVVHVGDHLVNAMRVGTSGEPRVPPLSQPAWDKLGLELGDLKCLMEEVDRNMEHAESLLLP
ncbi:MAG TPA: phosphohydrolase [Verrucomicrobiales bacterium]|nr:phosphohydrolase [Verrucomicrobiales bacterium]